jgi:5,10-methylenetetrahydromethanopterin reductase
MGSVLGDGEPADSPRALAEAGPLALSFFHGLMDGSLKARVPEALAPAVAEYRRLYERFEPADARYLTLHMGHFIRPRPEEERFLTAALIRDLTTTGTADELVERVRGLAAAGYQHSPSAWQRTTRTRSSGGRRCETASEEGDLGCQTFTRDGGRPA